jgi:D-serine deaminase-like pyridoxal phosphate-dependent protein
MAEAEMLARCGVKVVLLAYQPVGPNIPRLVELGRRYEEVSFLVIADDRGIAAELSKQFSRAGAGSVCWTSIGDGTDGRGPGREG